jgi:cytidylate kinase
MIVAIDGPAGSGKSTVARVLARRLGFTYLDSGALYRAVTLLALDRGANLDDGQELGRITRDASIELHERDHHYVQVVVDGRDVSEEIRSPRVTGATSKVAVHAQVRDAMLGKQRELIANGDYVVEGRDIGTVVAPGADLKLFLTAEAGERARRRAAELERRGHAADAEQVRAAIEERDRRDSTRAAAPMRPAEDAILLDTTGLDVDEVVGRAVELVRRAGTRA